MDHLDVGTRLAAMQRHPQRLEDEVSAHVRGELPADDHPRVRVEHEAKKTSPSQQRR
jgi:hypothetical protein